MLTPHDLARAYDGFLAALWRGDEAAATRFLDWLEWHRVTDLPREPETPPDAVTLLGPDPHGPRLHWYAGCHAILGYEPNPSRSGYRVPVTVTVPDER